MPSGWKCDLLAIEKIKEAIRKYQKKKGIYNPELTKAVQRICGYSEGQARNNIQAVEELLKIENSRINSHISKETILKKLKPTMLLEISKAEPKKKEKILKGLEDGTIKTIKDAKAVRIGDQVTTKAPLNDTSKDFKLEKKGGEGLSSSEEKSKSVKLGSLGIFKEENAIQWNIDLAIDQKTVDKLMVSLDGESIIHWMRHVLIDAIKKRIGE